MAWRKEKFLLFVYKFFFIFKIKIKLRNGKLLFNKVTHEFRSTIIRKILTNVPAVLVKESNIVLIIISCAKI